MNDSMTSRYENECKRILELERVSDVNGNLAFYPDSISWLVVEKIKRLLRLYSYIKEITIGRKWLKKTYKLKNSGKERMALVVGNGPSQGFFTKEDFNRFQKNGGELFVVNFWNLNEQFSDIVPNYLVLSDPETLNMNSQLQHLYTKNIKLKQYLLEHSSIKIICPVGRYHQISELFGEDRVLCFVDTEIKGFYNFISPIFPRPYISMTLYKALAMAIWFRYSKVFIIGMDNTYPRSLYSDKNNSILSHELHAGGKEFLSDISELYQGIGDYLYDTAFLFWDAKLFSKYGNIINLDPYSLTDAFKKVEDNNYSEYW